MKDVVAEVLQKEEMSISGIHREIKTRGVNIHKLVLTGYLRALTDIGLLKERSIPPSKVYSSPAGAGHANDVYSKVGELVKRTNISQRQQGSLALYILQRLFHRPIFQFEIVRAGFEDCPGAVSIEQEKRLEARKIVAKTGIKVPARESAFILPETDVKERYEELYQSFMEDIVLETTSSFRLRKSTRQTFLG